ncbi:MAG: GAF domain-containing protein [Chloroflexi bacterium]|nr:GAF domain-containing protein [Chloroflexota bacterium]
MSTKGHKKNRKKNYYRLLAENSRDIIMTQDIEGRIIYVNPAWTECTGYSAKETEGKKVTDFIDPKYLEDVRKRYSQRNAGVGDILTYEIGVISKDKSEIPLEIRSTPVMIEEEEFKEILLIGRDLRERKKAEQALTQSEEYYQNLFEDTPISLWEDDFSLVKNYIDGLKKDGMTDFQQYFQENPSAIDECIRLVDVINVNLTSVLLNKASSKADLLSNAAELYTRKSKLSFQENLVSLIEGKKLVTFQTVTKALDGSDIYQIMQWKVLPGYDESWGRVIVSVQDISALKQAQNSLDISEASYENLFNSIDDAIYIQDAEGHFLDVNEGAIKLYGIPREDFIGKTPDFLSAPGKNNLEEVARKIEKAFGGEAQEFEFWGRRKNGEIFPKEVRVYKGNYFGKDAIIAIGREITQRKNTEAALQAQLNELNILQATAFTSSQASDQKNLIRQITNIIGNTLYADNYGILLLDIEKETLYPHPSYKGVAVEEVYRPIHISKGVTGKVVSTGKALRINDIDQSKDYLPFTSLASSELCVPIKTGDEVIGVINAESAKKDFFTTDHERLLIIIAGQMSTAIEKIRLLETEQRRRQIAEKLQESAAILTTTLSQDEAIDLILEELSQVVSFDSASIQLLGDGYLEIVGGRGNLVLKIEKNRTFPFPGDNPNTKVIQSKAPLILKNAPQAYAVFKEMPSIQSWLGIPLIVQDSPIGILTLDSGKIAHFTEEDAQLVTSFANHAAIAIQNASLFKAEKTRRQEAEILRETALAVTASLNLKGAVKRILEQLALVLPYDSASVQILEGDELRIFGGRGWQNAEEVENLRFSLDGSNPNTRVIREKRTYILSDAQAEHAPFRSHPHNHIRSWMGIPLIVRNTVVGMLAIDSREKSYFTEESAKTVQSFAYQAAIAVENARLFDEEQRRRQEAETLRQSAHTISSSLNLDEVLNTILASIKRAIPYDSAAIMLLEGDRVKITGGHGLPNIERQIGKSFSTKDPLLEKLVKSSHPIIIADVQEKPYFKKWAETDYARGWMGVPLIVRSKVIGYITLDSREVDKYTSKDAELAQTFAHQAASAIENARLYEEAIKAAERHTVLHRLSQDILRDIESPEKTYQAIHRAAKELMPCDAFIISIREEGNDYDKAVFLIDQDKRYGTQKTSKKNSLISFVQRKKSSFISQDLSTEDQYQYFQENRFGAKEKARSLLVSPMYVGEKIVGVLSAQNYEPDIYTEKDIVLLEMLASHAAAAIENARLFYETVQRGKEFAELYRITQDLVAAQEMEVLLKTALKRAVLLLGVSCGDLYLYDKANNILNPAVSYGLPAPYAKKVKSTSLALGDGLVGHVAKTLEAFHVDDYHVWEGKSQHYQESFITSALGIPMLYAGNLIGAMSFYETHPNTHLFTQADERVMSLFSTQVAGAVHSASQFNQINNRLAELEAVNRTSTALRSAETPEEMFPVLLEEIRNSLNVEVCALWISVPNKKEVYRAASAGWVTDIKPDHQSNDAGLIGHIYQSGQNHISANLRTESYAQLTKGYEFPDGWGGAWVPIRSTENIIGVIAIMAERPRKFKKEDVHLLTTLAEIAGNAIQRARLHERTEKQVQRLTTLRNIDSAISSNVNLSITLKFLIDHTIAQLGVDAASILLATPTTQNLKYFIGSGFKTHFFTNTDLKKGEGLPSKAIKSRAMQSMKTPCKEEQCTRKEGFEKENFLKYYCVPLIAKGKVLGVLEIFHRKNLSPQQEWKDFLQALAGQAAIAIDNNYLFEDLKDSNEELARAYDTTLEGWGKALELRDKETQGHTLNVTDLTLQLSRKLGVSENNLIHIHRGALLHDIGKMGIPDAILRKPGPLSKEEWAIMRQHPVFAYQMLSSIPYLLPALDIPYSHHERWDGQGYPQGLKGEDIPIAARVFSVIDVWDALLSDRYYRKAWDRKTIINYLKNESGTRFDPKVVTEFLKMIGEK